MDYLDQDTDLSQIESVIWSKESVYDWITTKLGFAGKSRDLMMSWFVYQIKYNFRMVDLVTQMDIPTKRCKFLIFLFLIFYLLVLESNTTMSRIEVFYNNNLEIVDNNRCFVQYTNKNKIRYQGITIGQNQDIIFIKPKEDEQSRSRFREIGLFQKDMHTGENWMVRFKNKIVSYYMLDRASKEIVLEGEIRNIVPVKMYSSCCIINSKIYFCTRSSNRHYFTMVIYCLQTKVICKTVKLIKLWKEKECGIEGLFRHTFYNLETPQFMELGDSTLLVYCVDQKNQKGFYSVYDTKNDEIQMSNVLLFDEDKRINLTKLQSEIGGITVLEPFLAKMLIVGHVLSSESKPTLTNRIIQKLLEQQFIQEDNFYIFQTEFSKKIQFTTLTKQGFMDVIMLDDQKQFIVDRKGTALNEGYIVLNHLYRDPYEDR